jgi:cytochrome c peroxidase
MANNFQRISALFDDGVFGADTPACSACHNSNRGTAQLHELDLRTYRDHARRRLKWRAACRRTKVIIPGRQEQSGLFSI